MAEAKKRLLTYAGLKALEDELENLKVVKRKEVAQKIKEAREQGDLSENAEYDAAKDEQRDIEARIEELEGILKNAEVIVEDGALCLRGRADHRVPEHGRALPDRHDAALRGDDPGALRGEHQKSKTCGYRRVGAGIGRR